MGTLFSSLDIGLSGLRAAQIQLDVTGHNIANVNKTGFSRQRAELETLMPNSLSFGQIGRGVAVSGIVRTRDAFIDKVLRQQLPNLASASTLSQYYALIEDAFLEPTDSGFGTRLDDFYDALSEFSNYVEELPVREALVSEAEAMATSLNGLAQRIDDLRTNANEELRNIVPEINSIAEGIAELNAKIRQIEFSGETANDLRDDRDVLLDELASLVEFSYREADNGEVTVLIGSDVLVDALGAKEVEAVINSSIDPDRPDFLELQFVESGRTLDLTGGQAYAAQYARDTVLVEVDEQMDELAAALIQQLNSIQSQGNGLTNLSGTISSTNEVSAPGDALVSAGLPFPVTAGSFDVVVYDGSGSYTTTTITITATTTLNDLATALNGITGFSASVSGNTIDLGNTSGYTYAFANDSSGALTALGINGLFVGTDASTIAVNPDIQANPEWISSAYSLDELDTGDNSAAVAMAEIRNVGVLNSGMSTISEFYESLIAQVGVDANANEQTLEIEQSFVDDFEQRRQEVCGVSLDEEVTSLILYQRAYEAAARVISVTDNMLETLINIVG